VQKGKSELDKKKPKHLVFHRHVRDEILPNFLKRKHPRKEEKKKQGARTKVEDSKQPKRSRPQGGKGTTKNQTLHPSFSQLIKKKNCVKINKSRMGTFPDQSFRILLCCGDLWECVD
jgi:hypothetical protein